MTDQVPRSVEVLRQQARDELASLIEQRCRAGEDPWQFIPDMPSVDEQVVIALRAGALEDIDLGKARARAHHPAAGQASFERLRIQSAATDRTGAPGTERSGLGDARQGRARVTVRPAATAIPASRLEG
ncbi:hypothetical protein O159_07170 [Leifsonia xyli subsp. cynodontis DSM 46306]|uniref:Tryptophan synthase subunit alpha n=1 Tax=Leifsonia xyli subsp. cynodontis DSM 46306 TaxID=1389489 RepID=U3P570_LEIXC|nr:hypothetical protein [Leifsonia xyli]AGW40891.1 hypothetical protein O159_07170 [Leifsonia xyli subsp. cynodontis DSM 46306]